MDKSQKPLEIEIYINFNINPPLLALKIPKDNER